MERRRFLASAGLAGILAAGAAPAVHAGQAVRWRMATRLPRSMDIAHAGVQAFIRTIREMSDGRFEIALHGGEDAQPSSGVLDSVQRGSVELGHTSPAYYVAKDEVFALDGGIPFGLNARQTTAWLRHGNGLALLREFYREQGLVNIPMGNTGAHMGGWYKKPLRSVADLKGLRMRMLGLGSRLAERLGAKPVYLNSSETFNGLQNGSLDAAEWSAPHDDLRLGLHDHCKYYAHPGWWKGSAQFTLFVNRRAYDALADDKQAILEAAAAATHLEIQSQYDAKNPPALEQLVATGTHLVTLPKAILDAAWQASQELYAELSGKNPHWNKIYASYAAFQREQLWHWSEAETGYDLYLQDRQRQALAHNQKRKPFVPAARH